MRTNVFISTKQTTHIYLKTCRKVEPKPINTANKSSVWLTTKIASIRPQYSRFLNWQRSASWMNGEGVRQFDLQTEVHEGIRTLFLIVFQFTIPFTLPIFRGCRRTSANHQERLSWLGFQESERAQLASSAIESERNGAPLGHLTWNRVTKPRIRTHEGLTTTRFRVVRDEGTDQYPVEVRTDTKTSKHKYLTDLA